MGLDSIFLALVDATKTDKHPEFAGTVIKFLLQPEASNSISRWSDELTCAMELRRFSEACVVSPFIAETYPAMPSLKLVSQQLTGGLLNKLSTVALVARPIQSSSEGDREWLFALRTWVFLQTINAIFQGGSPNPYLVEVTNKLRLAIDRDERWLALFARLRGSPTSFNGVTRHLALAARRLLADQSVTSSVYRQLLGNLRNFCEGKTSESDDPVNLDDHWRFRSYIEQRAKPSHGLWDIDDPEKWGAPDTEDPDQQIEPYAPAFNFDPIGSEESVLAMTRVSEDETPVEQDRVARGILLATAEDHQFLPYSWNRPSTVEQVNLKKWISSALAGDDEQLKILAIFTAIATRTANSLETVLPTPLSAIPGPDWSLNIQQGFLHRLPPRRYNGWHVTPDAESWVETLAEVLVVQLASAEARTLQELFASAPASTQLGHLWSATNPASPAVLFGRTCRGTPGLERLRSGMLAQVMEQQVFEATSDPVLSQLLASHPRTGLGGACAYASYQHGLVQTLLTTVSPATPHRPEDGNGAQSNAAGSELSPLDDVLRVACHEALEKVNHLAAQPARWRDHHNAVTAYVVTVLLSTTGARPVSSPFEQLGHFDLSTCSIYIEDKVSSRLHQGRIVPVPEWVASLVSDYYLPHLGRMAELVADQDAPLSHELRQMSEGRPNDQLPLFFLLGSEPKLHWIEVSETSLRALEVFSWPLPWNLMRHRLATALKRVSVDHECINGITGHGENGTAAYGPYSMRIWTDDAARMRQPLTEILSRLALEVPNLPGCTAHPVRKSGEAALTSSLHKTTNFGSSARAVQRQASHESARKGAEAEILAFVADRPIDSLKPEQWEKLSQMMLLHEDRRPRTLGSIRYEALQQWISENWQQKGLRPRIKRRYLPALEEKSPFTADAIGCLGRINAALDIIQKTVESKASSRTSHRESLALGITMMILQSRLADPAMIDDLLQNRNYRLVTFQRAYFLEHSPGLDKVANTPVRRYAISETTFMLLAKAKIATITLDARQWPVSDSLLNLGKPFGPDAKQKTLRPTLLAMATQVQQANALQYPGVIAAYLNGEIVTAGLRHADWARVTLGKALNFKSPDHPEDDDAAADANSEDDENSPPPETVDTHFVTHSDAFLASSPQAGAEPLGTSERQSDCFSFFKQTRDALNEEMRKASPDRKNLDVKLRVLISEYKDRVSRSCLLLGEWQRSLLWRKSRKGLLRFRSVKRYFNALSVCFQAMAYEHDLLACDEEEVTDFYRRVMEIRQLVRPGKPSGPSIHTGEKIHSGDTDEEEKSTAAYYRSQSLALQLLRDFHRLMSREFGVEDPDWSEISVADELLSISPSILTETEYLCTLRNLAPAPGTAARIELARAFILLAAFRFGLRGAEVTGLLRSDWVDDQPDAIVVLVRGNSFRRLKTPAGQRQVPLLFVLTDHEKELIARWLDSWQGITVLNGKGPLFANIESPDELMNGQLLRREVGDAIKQVSCNSELSLHHARHSFANNVASLLMENTEGIWPHALLPLQTTPDRKNHVRRLLLSTDQVSRRTLWAIARLLGHAHPQASVRSYIHLLPELAAHYVNLPVTTPGIVVAGANEIYIDLDQLKEAEGYLEIKSGREPVEAELPLNAAEAMRYLHLRQRGTVSKRAQTILGISDLEAGRLNEALAITDQIFKRRPHINPALGGASILSSHITEARWNALTARAVKVKWPQNAQRQASITIKNLPEMIGPSRQILLWKSDYFSFFNTVVSAWKLSKTSYRFVCTNRGEKALLEIAAGAGLDEDLKMKLESELQAEKLSLQIDQVELENPLMLVKHRCAVLTDTGTGSDLRSSYELALIFMVSVALAELTESRPMTT